MNNLRYQITWITGCVIGGEYEYLGENEHALYLAFGIFDLLLTWDTNETNTSNN